MFAQAISAATTTGKEIIRLLFLSTQTVEPSAPFWKEQVFSWFPTESISAVLSLSGSFFWGRGVEGGSVGSFPGQRLIIKPGLSTIYAAQLERGKTD